MVTRQYHDELRSTAADDVEVLQYRVRRAAVPACLIDALLRRQQVDEFVHLGLQKRPAPLQMPQQAVLLVLGRDADLLDPGIEAVGQRKIDDAELAAEIHGGFRPVVGELFQTGAAAAGEHHGERAFGQLQSGKRIRWHGLSPFVSRESVENAATLLYYCDRLHSENRRALRRKSSGDCEGSKGN